MRSSNLAQLRVLRGAGYTGYLSFEPFAQVIGAAPDIEQRLAASMAYLSAALAASPAA